MAVLLLVDDFRIIEFCSKLRVIVFERGDEERRGRGREKVEGRRKDEEQGTGFGGRRRRRSNCNLTETLGGSPLSAYEVPNQANLVVAA
jgi:hypothetical protein